MFWMSNPMAGYWDKVGTSMAIVTGTLCLFMVPCGFPKFPPQSLTLPGPTVVLQKLPAWRMKWAVTGGCINTHGEAEARRLAYGGAAQWLRQGLRRGADARQHAGAACRGQSSQAAHGQALSQWWMPERGLAESVFLVACVPLLCTKQGSKEKGSGKPWTSPVAAPALLPHDTSRPRRKRWDHSFCLFLSGMIWAWVTCGTIWTLFLWKRCPTSSCMAQHISDAAPGIGQGTFLTEAFRGKAWACSNFANGARLTAGCNEQKRAGILRIHFPQSWCPLSAHKMFVSEPAGKLSGAESSLLEVIAKTQKEILVCWSMMS